VTYLYALKSGAVHYEGDRISVSNHLEIDGDVDFKTGNINFDGFVTIKGTVADGFSVVAVKDVEILGTIGIGSVKEVVSKEGSIYIKGGIAGKNKAVIRQKRMFTQNIFPMPLLLAKGVFMWGFIASTAILQPERL